MKVHSNRAQGLSVGVLGGFGTGNTGNDATAAVAVERLRTALPDVGLRLITTAEDAGPVAEIFDLDVVTLHRKRASWTRAGIGRKISRPWNMIRDLVRTWAVARSVDSVVVLGGGLFEGEASAGPSGWVGMAGLLVLSMASSLGKHSLAFVGVGGTYLPTRVERGMLAVSMGRADYRSFRDPWSLTAAVQMGAAGPGDRTTADLVFAVDPQVDYPIGPSRSPGGPSRPGRARGRVALGVMGFSWIALDDHGVSPTDPYVQALVGAAVELVEQGDEVLVFCGDVADHRVVDRVVELSRERLADRGCAHLVTSVHSTLFADHLRELASADVVVGSRFHNLVAAILLKRSTVAVADRVKVRDLMEHAGLGDYVLEARTLTSEALVEQVRRARDNRGDIQAVLAAVVAKDRERALSEIDELTRLIAAWAGYSGAGGGTGPELGALTLEPVSAPMPRPVSVSADVA